MNFECDVLVLAQDSGSYCEFAFPLVVAKVGNTGYRLDVGGRSVGEFVRREHAVHVMNFIVGQRNYYMYDQTKLKSVVISIPSNEDMEKIPDEYLLTGFPKVDDEQTADETTEQAVDAE